MTTVWQAVRTPSPTRTRIVLLYAFLAVFTVVAFGLLLGLGSAYPGFVAALQAIGGLVGTTVSATFLILIGAINLVVLVNIWHLFREVSQGGQYSNESLEELLENRGLLARIFRPMLRLVRKSWHMYPVGFLFGLGFDTASEVALLGLAVAAGGQQIPIACILVLPALFAAGMMTMDSSDQIMMLGAYGWAFLKPVRKLYYNLTITFISVVIAFVIGGIEVLSIISRQLGLEGGFWDFINGIDFGVLGLVIVLIFILSWVGSTLLYRWKGYDKLDHAPAGPPSTPA